MSLYNLTLVLVAITGITSYRAFGDNILKQNLIFRPTAIKERGEWYRFFTSALIHADWIHLLFNMYVLYSFGGIVEYFYMMYFGKFEGAVLYLVMYISSMGASSVYSYYKHQGSYVYSALGASGAVSAVVFSFIFFAPWAQINLFFFIPIPAILLGVGYLWYSNYMSKRNLDNIGHDAHFWGAVFGFLFTFIVALVLKFSLVTDFLNQLYQGVLISNYMY